jgi:hypothetical protein
VSSPEIRDDERWVPIATASYGDPGRTLQPIHDVLEAAGIPVGFDPYRPGDASSPLPQMSRAFRVVVPESSVGAALAAVREAGIAIPGESAPALPSEASAAGTTDSAEASSEAAEPNHRARNRRLFVFAGVLLLLIILGCAYLQALIAQLGLLDSGALRI